LPCKPTKPTKCTTPTRLDQPTEDELKLLKYLHLSDRANVWVDIIGSQHYEISNYRTSRKVQIPCSALAFRPDQSLKVRPFFDNVLFYYPRIGTSKRALHAQARNLRIVLIEIEAQLKARKAEKLLALKAAKEAAEEARLRTRLEYSGMETFDSDRSW
jgi:hypothetical protein